mgnify:CR=1 FL=1|jgi:hypothetical protein
MTKKHQTRARAVLMTPKTPVVSSEVLVPVTPIDLKMVGELLCHKRKARSVSESSGGHVAQRTH